MADAEAALKLDPKDASAYNLRAMVRCAQDKPDRALKDFGKALECLDDPAWQSKVRSNRALAYFALGEHEKALDDASGAISRNPKNATAYLNRGLIRWHVKEFGNALKDYEEGLKINAEHAAIHCNLALLLASCPDAKIADGKKALAHAKKACKLSSWADADCVSSLACAYAECGQFKEAVKFQRQAMDLVSNEKKLKDLETLLESFLQNRPYRVISKEEFVRREGERKQGSGKEGR